MAFGSGVSSAVLSSLVQCRENLRRGESSVLCPNCTKPVTRDDVKLFRSCSEGHMWCTFCWFSFKAKTPEYANQLETEGQCPECLLKRSGGGQQAAQNGEGQRETEPIRVVHYPDRNQENNVGGGLDSSRPLFGAPQHNAPMLSISRRISPAPPQIDNHLTSREKRVYSDDNKTNGSGGGHHPNSGSMGGGLSDAPRPSTDGRQTITGVTREARIVFDDTLFIRYIPESLATKEFLWHLLAAHGELSSIDFLGPLETTRGTVFRVDNRDNNMYVTYAAFVSFSNTGRGWRSAASAIRECNDMAVDVHSLLTQCFDETKIYRGPPRFKLEVKLAAYQYCKAFIQKKQCDDDQCREIHQKIAPEFVYTYSDIRNDKHLIYQRQLLSALRDDRKWDQELARRRKELAEGRFGHQYEQLQVRYLPFFGPKRFKREQHTLG